jgi:uncharacterized protein (TIGR02246 family)
MNARIAGLVTVLCVALAPLPAAPSHVTPVEDVSQQWAGYWNAKNLDAIMKLYAPEAVFLPVSGERWEGLGQIRRHFADGLARYDPSLIMRSVRSDVSGNFAYDSGTYSESVAPVKGGREFRAKGNYLILFQRKSRRAPWKILEQIWTEYDPSRL